MGRAAGCFRNEWSVVSGAFPWRSFVPLNSNRDGENRKGACRGTPGRVGTLPGDHWIPDAYFCRAFQILAQGAD